MGNWKTVFDKADFVIYLIRCDFLRQNRPDYLTRLMDDARHIQQWRETKAFSSRDSRQKDFILVITYCDTDPSYKTSNYDGYIETWTMRSEITRLLPYFGPDSRIGIVAGSLETEDEAKKLVYRIYKLLY